MIGTAREYAAAKRQAKELEAALQELEANKGGSHPNIERALIEGYAGELAHVSDEMERFDAVRSGRTRTLTISSLEKLGEAVVLARTAAGKTQKELARDLGVKPQQIQRDEATRYDRAGIDRLHAVMCALEIKFEGELRLGAATEDGLPKEAAIIRPSNHRGRGVESGGLRISSASATPMRVGKPMRQPVAYGLSRQLPMSELSYTHDSFRVGGGVLSEQFAGTLTIPTIVTSARGGKWVEATEILGVTSSPPAVSSSTPFEYELREATARGSAIAPESEEIEGGVAA